MIILPSNNDYINQSGRSKLFFLILACVILNEQWFLQRYPLNLSLSKPFNKHKYPTKSSGHHKLIATMSVDYKQCSLTIRPRQDSVLCYCCDTFFQLKMISEGKLHRQQRKRTKMVQCKILQLWDDYANNKTTASHLLKKCGSLYTPGV